MLCAVLCAVATYWVVTLAAPAAPLAAAAARTPVQTDDAAALFGGQLTHNPIQDLHLFGILSLPRGAAAIIGTGGDMPRTVSLGNKIVPDATLVEVRPRSVVVERNGVHAEVFLPTNTPSPAIYMR